MSRMAPLLACACVAVVPAIGQGQALSTTASPDRVTINDNRTAAGLLNGTTLTMRLEARLGKWHPDRDSDPGVVVKAFAVDGGPLQVPGPIIRVREGTDIRASVRNSLTEPLVLHGFYSRPDQRHHIFCGTRRHLLLLGYKQR